MSKYGHRTGNWLESIVNKLGGEHEADLFLRGELAVCVPDRCWREQDGVIYFTVVSDGTTSEDWITKKICAEAEQRTLFAPNVEIACLIRDKFTDEEIEAMGLVWIVTMHEPITGSDGRPVLLSADRGGGVSWLGAWWDDPGIRWDRKFGFAFVVSQS